MSEMGDFFFICFSISNCMWAIEPAYKTEENYHIYSKEFHTFESYYCKFGNFREGFIFAKLRIGMLRENKILAKCRNQYVVTDIGKSCPSCKFLTSQICLSMIFAKIKFLRKFLDLQYCI